MPEPSYRPRPSRLPVAGPAPQGPAPEDPEAAGDGGTRAAAATAALRELILSFALKPGESLPERRLERLLRVSRSPVRQALAELAREGLVRRQGRSFAVAPVDLAEIEELFAFREVLESAAVRWAARAPQGGAEARAALEALDALDERAAPELRLATTASFHLGLARASGNRFVADALAALFPRVTRVRYLELSSARTVARADDEHRRIVGLVEQGRGDEAALLMQQHLERTLQHLRRSLERQRGVRRVLGEGLP